MPDETQQTSKSLAKPRSRTLEEDIIARINALNEEEQETLKEVVRQEIEKQGILVRNNRDLMKAFEEVIKHQYGALIRNRGYGLIKAPSYLDKDALIEATSEEKKEVRELDKKIQKLKRKIKRINERILRLEVEFYGDRSPAELQFWYDEIDEMIKKASRKKIPLLKSLPLMFLNYQRGNAYIRKSIKNEPIILYSKKDPEEKYLVVKIKGKTAMKPYFKNINKTIRLVRERRNLKQSLNKMIRKSLDYVSYFRVKPKYLD